MNIQRERSNDVSIHIQNHRAGQLLLSMKSRLGNLSPISSDRCIYRVPKKLREVNENAYTPRLVSIGPFHHGKTGLEAMEEHKWRHLQNFLQQNKVKLEDLVKFVRDREEIARNCYAETIKMSSDEFIQMLVVDATFTIDMLLSRAFPQLTCEIECIYNRSGLMFDVYRDFLLIENQLPFYIIGDVLDFAKSRAASRSNKWPTILELTHAYFNSFMPLERTFHTMKRYEVRNFVDFLRICHRPIIPRQQPKETTKFEKPRTLIELREAGVRFKVAESKHLMDIKISEGTLEIPNISVSEMTEVFFRNLIAFEQCHCDVSYVTDYIVLIDSLIDTADDVELLVSNGIMDNMLANNSEAAMLFNNLGKEIFFDSNVFYYSVLCEDLNVYCKVRWHKWRAALKHKYFNSPWTVISVIAASILLLLTFIQTMCSVIQL